MVSSASADTLNSGMPASSSASPPNKVNIARISASTTTTPARIQRGRSFFLFMQVPPWLYTGPGSSAAAQDKDRDADNDAGNGQNDHKQQAQPCDCGRRYRQ